MFNKKNDTNGAARIFVLGFAALVAFGGVAGSGNALAEDAEISEKWVRIEINATDGDAGFQGMGDADGWQAMTIRRIDPTRKLLYRVRGYAGVREQGLTENFFESAEPDCEEQPLDEFLERFPAGRHNFWVKTVDDETLKGASFLTHELPGAPEMLAPTGGGIDETQPVVISWTAGNTLGNCPPDGVDISDPGSVPLFGYEVVVEREEPEPLLIYTVQVAADQTSVTLPPEFVQEEGIYKFEVVAIESRLDEDDEEEKGNQTISEAFFCTTGINPCELPE